MSGYIPLQQAWAYQSHFLVNVLMFWDINSDMNKQLNFVNMLKHTSRNVSNTTLHAFLVFGSISKHFHHTSHSPGPLDLLSPR